MSSISGKIKVQISGNFMKNLNVNQSKNIKKLEFNFSQNEKVYTWSKSVHLDLPKRIGVYLLKNDNGEVIYVGLANGREGLFGRHKGHEKKHLFELFDAKELIVFFCDDLDLDDPGKIAVLERYFIYTLEPVLNNDIKLSKSTNAFAIVMMNKKLDEMLSTSKLSSYLYSRMEELQQKLIDLKEDEEQKRKKYHDLLVKLYFESVVELNENEKAKHIGMLKRCNSYKVAYQESTENLEGFATEENIKQINNAFEVWRV